jgi:hypothetical protein
MSNPCIITGCNLWIPAERKWLHGDLWAWGDVYILNGVLNNRGTTDWKYTAFSLNLLFLTLEEGKPYFDRRGIIVMKKSACRLSLEAEAYVAKWED